MIRYKYNSITKLRVKYLNSKKINGELFLVVILLCVSGNPALSKITNMDYIYIGLSIYLAIKILLQGKKLFTRSFIVTSTIFGFILLSQVITFSFFPFVTWMGFYTRLFIGFAVMKLVNNFPKVYVQTMFYLAILSLLFYIPDQIGQILGPSFRSIFFHLRDIIGEPESFRDVIGFHTFMINTPHRNAGMFWEPGAFAGYLIVALVFLGSIKKELSKKDYKLYLLVLSAVLLTTMSTTGYLIFPLAMVLHYDFHKLTFRSRIGRGLLVVYILLPLIVLLSSYFYQRLDFLGTKIESQYMAVEYRTGRWHATRFGSLVLDWEYIKRRPLTGWGPNPKTRYTLHPWIEDSEGMGNGMSDFTAKFGITGMLIFGITFFRGIMYVTNRHLFKSLLAILIIFLVLQGEAFLTFPLFLGLMFLDRSKQSNKASNVVPVPIRSIGSFR